MELNEEEDLASTSRDASLPHRTTALNLTTEVIFRITIKKV